MQVSAEETGEGAAVGFGCQLGGKPFFWIGEGCRWPTAMSSRLRRKSRAEVDAFYRAALAAGGKDNGTPGLRPHYHANYYGAFVLDPDGNNIEAVCHAR